jgi:hypothetical protein
MKKPKSEPALTRLDPSHPNHDAILLKRNRLEAHRRRRLENRGELAVQNLPMGSGRSGKKTDRRKDV